MAMVREKQSLPTDVQKAIQTLHDIYGDHSRAAEELGLSITYYRTLRNGRYRLPERTANYIILKSKDAAAKVKKTTK